MPILTAQERALTHTFNEDSVSALAIPLLEAQPGSVGDLLEKFGRIRSRNGYNNVVYAAHMLGLKIPPAALRLCGVLCNCPTAIHLAANAVGDTHVLDALYHAAMQPCEVGRTVDLLLEGSFLAIERDLHVPEHFLDLVDDISHYQASYDPEDLLIAIRRNLGLLTDWDDDPVLDLLSDCRGLILAASKERRLDLLAAGAMPHPHKRMPEIRSGPQVGRNDPCPCGSGKKFKKCCLGKEEAATDVSRSSIITGVTEEEFWANPEQYLKPSHASRLDLDELLQLDLAKLPHEFFDEVLLYSVVCGDVALPVELYEAHDVVQDWPKPSSLLRLILDTCPWAAKVWLPRLQKLHESGWHVAEPEEIELLTAQDNPALHLERLESFARLLLEEEDRHNPNQEAHLAFLFCFLERPALATLLARSVRWRSIGSRNLYTHASQRHAQALYIKHFPGQFDPYEDFLLEVQEARAKSEPASRAEGSHSADEWRSLERKLADREKRLSELDAKVSALQRATAEAAPAKESPAPAPADPDLRERLRLMREELVSTHRERNALRRELDQLHQSHTTGPSTPDPDDPESDTEDDDWETDATHPETRIPIFADSFRRETKSLPPHIVARAISSAGRMAAAERNAYADVKRLKTDRRLYRKRIGDYRLLFTLPKGELVVWSLVPRGSLERTISKLADQIPN